MKERKARVEDALHAARAAVAGGGVADLRAAGSLEKLDGENQDQTAAVRIIARPLEEPRRQIADNAGDQPDNRR